MVYLIVLLISLTGIFIIGLWFSKFSTYLKSVLFDPSMGLWRVKEMTSPIFLVLGVPCFFRLEVPWLTGLFFFCRVSIRFTSSSFYMIFCRGSNILLKWRTATFLFDEGVIPGVSISLLLLLLIELFVSVLTSDIIFGSKDVELTNLRVFILVTDVDVFAEACKGVLAPLPLKILLSLSMSSTQTSCYSSICLRAELLRYFSVMSLARLLKLDADLVFWCFRLLSEFYSFSNISSTEFFLFSLRIL